MTSYASLACALAVIAGAVPAAAADLSLTIRGARNPEGSVWICVWSDGAKFPDCGAGKPLERRKVPASALGRAIVFRGLKPGTLAVSVLHDENDNGKLDTNLLGIPREGIAVSNDRMPKFSAPQFQDAAFRFAGTSGISVTLVYR